MTKSLKTLVEDHASSMSRVLFVAALALVMVFGGAAIAMANYGPHGGYLTDTDACAGCHRAHVAFSDLTWSDNNGDARNALLVSDATTMRDFCYACHGNTKTGAATNVQGGVLDTALSGDSQAQAIEVGKQLNGGGFETINYGMTGSFDATYGGPNASSVLTVPAPQTAVTSSHTVDAGQPNDFGEASSTVYSTIWGSWGPGSGSGANGPGETVALTCTNCHDPHGSSNYRLLNDAVNGRTVGGYVGGFASDPDPEPNPWVISNEIGYPNGVGTTDLGWRLHKNTWANMDGTPTSGEYMPDYTNAAYARPAKGAMNGAWTNKGMTGWCTRACHDQYAVKVGNLVSPGEGSSFGTYSSTGTYNPGDASEARNRHRHPVNVPLTNWGPAGAPVGDRDLIYNPRTWTDWDPGITYVDLPLLHDPATDAQGNPDNQYAGGLTQGNQANTLDDGLDCLTCHRAHGSAAIMTGYADSASNVNPSRDSNPNGTGGTMPTNDSALLRANNRGVCERCHNK